MTTLHRWFRSGKYSLLGHTDFSKRPESVGVLIVPPFGFDDVCCYRPLRFLARTLAARGIPTLRFDLPGTGDSSGGLLDTGLLEQWILSIDAAAGELRQVSGVEHVAVLGIRLGGMLAAMAAARGARVEDLVLWGPALNGHGLLREWRAFARMERWEYSNGAPAPPQPFPGFEVGGFLIGPELLHDLEALDLAALASMRGRRVLILSRDNLRPDSGLVCALQSAGCALHLATGSGYSAMTALPHEALPPTAAAGTIVDFLAANDEGKAQETPPVRVTASAATIAGDRETAVIETVHTIGCFSGTMFGILAEPALRTPRADCCVLLLNAGGVRHTGPNRMWVQAARRWAAAGVASLRLDLHGVGESDGDQNLDIPSLYQEQMVDQVELAMDSLHSLRGFRRFAAIGLCSGAFWAFHAALRRRDLSAAILINPRLLFWDPGAERRRILKNTLCGLASWADWSRVAHGGFRRQDLKRAARILLHGFRAGRANSSRPDQAHPYPLQEAWKVIERHGTCVTLLFTEGEPLLDEMEQQEQMPPETHPLVRCFRVANAGHTFRPQWAQQLAHEILDSELSRAGLLASAQFDRHAGLSSHVSG
jgi:pimeloyl-ACP methyl ester carboxylesterase